MIPNVYCFTHSIIHLICLFILETPQGFPRLASKSSVIVNEKNTRVVLECKVTGDPKPDILWLRDSVPIDVESSRIKLLSLSFTQYFYIKSHYMLYTISHY